MEKKVIAVICGSSGEAKRAWYEYLQKYKNQPLLFRHDFGGKWIQLREDNTVVTYYFYLPSMELKMTGQVFDEVIWYGTARGHSKYKDILDYLRLHARKIGEF